jgi:tripartite-type tricarboxylate transporter receptor subunit TctC
MIAILLRAFLALALVPAAVGTALAQGFPSKSIRVVVPYAPGGGTDNLIRIVAPTLSASLGQQIVIDNRPGAAGVIGTEIMARAQPDGHTILVTDSAFLVNPGLQPNMPFDTLKSFRGIAMMASAPVILVAHPSVSARSIQELVTLAKAKPGSLNYASGGNGASTHLAGELLKIAAGIDLVHIPYKGTAPAMNDLLAGQVAMQFAGISSARQHIDAGKLVALAVTGERRNPAVPAVPTFIESGIRGVDADTYWGAYAPAGTSDEIVGILNRHLVRALRAPEHRQRLIDLGFEAIANAPAAHDTQMRAMIASWAELVRKANIRPD